MHGNEQYLFEALKAGASGYALKSVADRDLVQACAPPWGARRSSTRGDHHLIRDYLRADRFPDLLLPPREEEIVKKLVAEGRSSMEIGDLLVISPKTVDRHARKSCSDSACAIGSS